MKVGIFSLEMSGKELAQRIICAESGISISQFRMGAIPKASWDGVAAACCDIPGNDIEIEDKANVTIGDICATAARMLRGAERGLIVIDYLQLISSASDGSKFQNRAVEVGEISRRLKVLAKELGVPVVTLAQLSRQAEFHPGAPRLSDLRESGSIEQDADTVLFLSRDPDEIEGEKSAQGRSSYRSRRTEAAPRAISTCCSSRRAQSSTRLDLGRRTMMTKRKRRRNTNKVVGRCLESDAHAQTIDEGFAFLDRPIINPRARRLPTSGPCETSRWTICGLSRRARARQSIWARAITPKGR